MIEIIPAIDIIDGKCVRLEQGDFSKATYYKDSPLNVAWQFEKEGAEKIHIVDLDGAKDESMQNIKQLTQIRRNTNLKIDFSGGIRSRVQINRLFEAGADFITIGSMAIKNYEEFRKALEEHDPARFILAADTKNGNLLSDGWTKITNTNIVDFIQQYRILGITNVMSTDVTKDGMLSGTNITYYRQLQEQFPDMNLIASGGISTSEEIVQLNETGIKGVIIGKAFYERRLNLKKVLDNLHTNNNKGNK
ncbi:MAG: 1-(5-phosphoribosyl)-5-[(5-phosphoribosylamino)methylideneamino]imidazole-4-carboxamide isomerase [Bacteroidales bacterium]